jgi:hypothetical protein
VDDIWDEEIVNELRYNLQTRTDAILEEVIREAALQAQEDEEVDEEEELDSDDDMEAGKASHR